MNNTPLTFKKAFRDCITENDGNSVCPFRVCGMLMSFVGITIFAAAAITMLTTNHQIDFQQFGIGFASMTSSIAILAGGVALKATTDTDPSNPSSTPPQLSFPRRDSNADKTV